MQTREIHTLVRRAKAGDKAATDAITIIFRPLLCKAAAQRHFAPVREDAQQEAAVALLGAIRDFDEARDVPFEGYAKAMVYGHLRTFFKQERRRWQREILPAGIRTKEVGDETEDFFGRVADERDEIGAFEAREAFRASLASLPAREQKILTLYYEKGLSLRDVGERLGMTEKHVSVVKARAMKKLRATLGVERTRRERTKKRRPRGRRERG